MKLNHLPMFIGVCALASGACSIDVGGEQAVLSEDKRFPVTGNVDLSLTTFDGSIEVRSWDRNEVLVRIERRAPTTEDAKALKVETRQEGDRIVVDAPGRDGVRSRSGEGFHFGVWRTPTVSFVVNVPRKVTLNARTSDGSVAATDLTGAITLESGDGSIQVDRVEGHVKAHTGDGSIEADDVRGTVDLDSGDGSIQLRGRLEDLRVHSGDGSVTAEVEEGSAMKADWSITTGDGRIALRLPSSFDAEIDAESGDGTVSADGITSTSSRDEGDRDIARGRLGKGGHLLRVRSGDGTIQIRTR